MTFAARETSADLGQPFELYEFVRGVQRWRYTSADRNIIWSLQTFASTAISRGPVEVGPEINRQNMRITAPRDLAAIDSFRVSAPTEPILVTVWGSHNGDPDAQFVVVWQGRILSVDWQGLQAQITAESVWTSLRRTGLRRAWQRNCPHVLYGGECKVVRTSYQLNAVVSGVSGAQVTASAFAGPGAGYFKGGFLEFVTVDSVTERRYIVEHGTSTITLDRAIPGLVVGSGVAVFPGCDHTTGAAGCGRFANTINYGGTPYIPEKNPFEGDPMY